MFEQVFVVMALAVLALALTTVAVMAVITMRGVRRASRAARETCRRVGATLVSARGLGPRRATPSGPTSAGLSVFAADARATVGSPGWWMVQRDRHHLWRRVAAAEHAVKVAQRSNVMVGDLPLLAAQLDTAARGVDSVYRASSRVRSLRPQARRDARGIEVAAQEIHHAALDSLRATATADIEPMLSAIRIEVAALAAGASAARAFPRLPAR
jgi:hypothetical protein